MSAHGEDSATQRGADGPDPAAMSRDELVRLGSALDDVEIVDREDPFPVPGTRAEKRTERQVAAWFALAGLSGLAFLGFFLFWPWEYAPPGARGEQHLLYQLYTPLVGFFFGLSVLAVGIGAISYAKHLLPHETSVQQRHDGRSSEVDRRTVTAILADAGERSHLGRRSLLRRTAGFGAGVMGLGLGAFTLGGLLRNPWKGGDDADLWITGWASPDNERVYLRRSTGESHDVALVKAEDLAAGAIETVFPFRESERDVGGTARIRQSGDADQAAPRAGGAGRQAQGPGGLQLRRLLRLHEDLQPPGLPDLAVRGADGTHPLSVPPVAVRRAAVRQADLRSGDPLPGATAPRRGR
jgi:ubiquinol-cytochrome c reductase iron-sulfur subunit